MKRPEAARALSIADADVLSVEETEHGTRVACRDGSTRLIAHDGGLYAIGEHPATRSWRQFEPPAAPARAQRKTPPATPRPAKARTRKAPKKKS